MHPVTFLTLLLLTFPVTAMAAHGLIFPSDDIVSQGEASALTLQVSVFDPLEGRSRQTAKPMRFGVQHLGEQTDLLATLKPTPEQIPTGWTAAFAIKRPGDYTFYSELPPSWDAADEQFIVHHAKLCVNALGLEEGWDEPVGLEAEIVPLSRPYGLWTGNLFSGQVLLNGDPAPYVGVEITWLGDAPATPAPVAVPAAPYRLQKVRADANGVFHYAMPRAGWWGFAATLDADWTVKRDGAEKPVALVSSYWVQTRDLK
jgi:cobalt/nickel transport protein